MENVWLQVILTGGTVVAGMFFTIRYSINQSAKREKAVLENNEKMQQMQLDYYETKNGHMERMAKDFTLASTKMSKAISQLSGEIKVLSSKK